LEQLGKRPIFGHSLEDILGGQIDVGFAPTGFYGEPWPDEGFWKLFPGCMATRATKPLESIP
jgi:hypothetical protein